MTGAVMGAAAFGFTPTIVIHTTGSGATETIPAGASNVVIEVWAGGATGGTAGASLGGDGGGAGGYARTSVACSGLQTLTYTVGAADANSSCSSGTLTITTMTCNKGTVTAGGTATGGTQANTTGGNGTSHVGGTGGTGATGTSGNQAGDGSPYGKGGDGGTAPNGTGNPGQTGAVVFSYT